MWILSPSSGRRGVKIGGVDHRRGGVSRQQQRRAGAIFTPAAGPGCDPRKSRPRKTPHGKRATKKR
nr:MAG TPA: hypothetical protein [Caudoviricetes sp.]